MISINVTVTSDVTGNVYERVIHMNDQDMPRILAACNAKFLGDAEERTVEELMAQTTSIFDRVVDSFWGSIRTTTRDYEVAKAQAIAADTVVTIEDITGQL